MPGTPTSSNVGSKVPSVQTVTGQAVPIIAVTDATATAQTATELLNPYSVSGTAPIWIKRGPGIRGIRVRARLTTATTAVATTPIVRVLGVMAGDGATLPTASSPNLTGQAAVPRRLDASTDTAAGLTLDLPASPSATTALGNGTYRYGTPSSKIDLEDCDWYIVLVERAAAITLGTCDVEVIEMN